MTKTASATTGILSLLLLPAALASNPFVSLGLNEDFVRLDKHAHDARLRKIAAANNANKPILSTKEKHTNVQMAQSRDDNGGRPPFVNAIAHAVEDCDPDMLFEKERSRHQQGAKLV